MKAMKKCDNGFPLAAPLWYIWAHWNCLVSKWEIENQAPAPSYLTKYLKFTYCDSKSSYFWVSHLNILFFLCSLKLTFPVSRNSALTSALLGESKKILNNSAFMQSERSISLLNLFHQKSPKWIYQSPPNPPQFPQNGGYHSPKDSSYLFMVCRGWHLKMGEFYIKLYQDSVSNANVFCYLITKPLISYFLMMTLKRYKSDIRSQK